MLAVIGGGASGLMAALTAAQRGEKVLLLERQARVGRKLLATGNGRCNLSNLHLDPARYHGQEPAFARPALTAFGCQEALSFFRELGLVTVAQTDGRVYPLSDQAGSVVDVLRLAADAAGVQTRTGVEVTAIRPVRSGFQLRAGEETFSANRVIICCGGAAGAKLGGGDSGYRLLRTLGHSVTPLRPALVQLKTDTTYVRALKGVRADAAVELRDQEEVLARSAGEVQFTDYGVSGPAVFEISRAASCAEKPVRIHLDLLRDLDFDEVLQIIERRKTTPGLTLENLLTGTVHNRLGRTVLRYAGFSLNAPAAELRQGDCKKIAAALKNFTLPVQGTMGFDSAQVTAGGADTRQFYAQTLQSRLVPGLYAAGEVLDIDGDCGGFNLQWAWASGRLAGMLL